MEEISPIGRAILNQSQLILAEPALIFDSVYAFAKGLERAVIDGPDLKMSNLSCEEELPWNGGSTLFSYVSSVKFDGLTGPVSFAENKRTDFKLDFLKLKESSLEKVGEWTPAGGLNISDKYAFSHGRPPNITLRVMSRIEHPFVMKTTAKDGNDRFEVSSHFLKLCYGIQRESRGAIKATFHCYFE